MHSLCGSLPCLILIHLEPRHLSFSSSLLLFFICVPPSLLCLYLNLILNVQALPQTATLTYVVLVVISLCAWVSCDSSKVVLLTSARSLLVFLVATFVI